MSAIERSMQAVDGASEATFWIILASDKLPGLAFPDYQPSATAGAHPAAYPGIDIAGGLAGIFTVLSFIATLRDIGSVSLFSQFSNLLTVKHSLPLVNLRNQLLQR